MAVIADKAISIAASAVAAAVVLMLVGMIGTFASRKDTALQFYMTALASFGGFATFVCFLCFHLLRWSLR